MKYIILAMFFAVNINAMEAKWDWNKGLENIVETLRNSDSWDQSLAINMFFTLSKALKEHNIEFNTVHTSDNNNLLSVAVVLRNLKSVLELVRGGIDVDTEGPEGKTALMLAAEEGDRRMCELLIRLGANLYLVSDSQQTAYDCAKSDSRAKNFLGSLYRDEPSSNTDFDGPQERTIKEPQTIWDAIDKHWSGGDYMLLPALIEQKTLQGKLSKIFKPSDGSVTPLEYALQNYRFEAAWLILGTMLKENILPEAHEINNLLIFITRYSVDSKSSASGNKAIAAYEIGELLKYIRALQTYGDLRCLTELPLELSIVISMLTSDCYENTCLKNFCHLKEKPAKIGLVKKCIKLAASAIKKK